MKKVVIGICIGALLANCSTSRPRITKDMLAPEAEYPEVLSFERNAENYVGVPELVLLSERNQFSVNDVGSPIETFEAAFNYAYKVLVEKYGVYEIDEQLPLLIDFEDGVWIVEGAIRHSEDPNTIAEGGTAYLAFIAESGDVLYVLHSF